MKCSLIAGLLLSKGIDFFTMRLGHGHDPRECDEIGDEQQEQIRYMRARGHRRAHTEPEQVKNDEKENEREFRNDSPQHKLSFRFDPLVPYMRDIDPHGQGDEGKHAADEYARKRKFYAEAVLKQKTQNIHFEKKGVQKDVQKK